MKGRKMVKKQEVLPPENGKELESFALTHDAKLVYAVNSLKSSLSTLAEEGAVMRDESKRLWRFVKDPNTDGMQKGCFATWRDYARSRLGDISSNKLYEIAAVHSLTRGANPVPAADIDQLGVKKAAQLARLPEKDRTKARIKKAKSQTVREVTKEVDKVLDKQKPPSERKEKLVSFSVSLSQSTIDLIEKLEHDGVWLKLVRDGDKSLSLKAKLWHAVIWYFYDSHREALAEAALEREAFIAANHKGQPDSADGERLHRLPA